MKISIIVSVVNNIEYLKKCFDSLHKYTKDFELIVIDNNSEAEIKQYLKSCDYEMKVITNKSNMGYAYGCNQGIVASNKRNKYLCFIDADVVFTPNWLDKLLDCMKENMDCGMCGPSTCSSRNPQAIRDLVDRRFKMSQEAMNKVASELEDRIEEAEIYGFCALVRREALDKVGFFDWKRYYPGISNESDLFHRIMQFGYKMYWVKGAYVHHYLGVSKTSINKKKGDNRKICLWGQEKYRYRLEFLNCENAYVDSDVTIEDIRKC